jgi:hypothetical protein
MSTEELQEFRTRYTGSCVGKPEADRAGARRRGARRSRVKGLGTSSTIKATEGWLAVGGLRISRRARADAQPNKSNGGRGRPAFNCRCA